MKIEKREIARLKRLAIKNPEIDVLLQWYELMTQNPAYDSYVTRVRMLTNWNNEILEDPESFKLKSKNDATDHAMKFIEKQPAYVRATKELQDMLTGAELNKAEQDPRLRDGPDTAFPTALDLKKIKRDQADGTGSDDN